MTTTTRRAVAAALLVGLLTACSTGHQQHRPAPVASIDPASATLPGGRGGVPAGGLPDLAKVDGSDPQAVARAALTVIWNSDTAIDTSQHDAELRAMPLYTARRAAEVQTGAPRSAPGAEWSLWASHRAYTTVQLQESHEDGGPSDGPTTVYRRWAITVTPTGRDGWTGQPKQVTALVVLTHASDTQPWRLDTLTLG